MTVIYITIFLLIIAVVLFLIGKFWLTKYAFKYSSGLGIAVLLVPGMTGYFSFYKFEREGKELFITMWLAGLAIALVTCATFFGPLQDIASGRAFTQEYADSVDVDLLGNRKKPKKPAPDLDPEPRVEEPVKPKVEEPVKPAADAGATPAVDSDAGAAAPADGKATEGDAGGAAAPADGKAPADGDAKKPAEGAK